MTLDNGILLLYPSTYMYKQAHIYTYIHVHTHSHILWTYIVFKSTTIIHKVIEVFFLLIFEGQSSVNVTSLKRFRGYNRSKSGIFQLFLNTCMLVYTTQGNKCSVRFHQSISLEFDTAKISIGCRNSHIKLMYFSNNSIKVLAKIWYVWFPI